MKTMVNSNDCGSVPGYDPRTAPKILEAPKTDILRIIDTALRALKNHENELNRLNVYPVPDGDTGTNMVLTMQTVLSEAVKTGEDSMIRLAPAIIYGSLMGARGNSGVILSQIVKGFCEELVDGDGISSDTIIKALRNASDVAYRAVKKPVEGTMLTVISDMAKAGERLSGGHIEPRRLLEYIIEEGKRSVERTPSLLPVLREAGVVDAGGHGLVVLAQGILAALKGETLQTEIQEEHSVITTMNNDIKYAYCTELILKSEGIDMDEFERRLNPLGDSVLVVGTPELTKIHIHTNAPGEVINIATSLGAISNVQIGNILEQSQERSRFIEPEPVSEKTPESPARDMGIIAVSNGEGVNKILLSLGADRIVFGGQSMNPSTADLLKAIDDLPNKNIVILPNNKNIIMAAQQVSGLTDKNVVVIPTKSVPEAFAAMTAFNAQTSFELNAADMIAALTTVKTGELTYAVRADTNGGFDKDDYIGIYADAIKATGKDLTKTALDLIEAMVDDNDEIVTVLVGDQVSDEQMDLLFDEIDSSFPDLDVDIHRGDQPVYHLVIGIE